jgi:hypothetical protein
MENFADENITTEQALHDSMDCLRMAATMLRLLNQNAVADMLRKQADKNLRILGGVA